MNRKDLAIIIERYDEASETGFDQDPIELAARKRAVSRREIEAMMKDYTAKGGTVRKAKITDSSGNLVTAFNPWYR